MEFYWNASDQWLDHIPTFASPLIHVTLSFHYLKKYFKFLTYTFVVIVQSPIKEDVNVILVEYLWMSASEEILQIFILNLQIKVILVRGILLFSFDFFLHHLMWFLSVFRQTALIEVSLAATIIFTHKNISILLVLALML